MENTSVYFRGASTINLGALDLAIKPATTLPIAEAIKTAFISTGPSEAIDAPSLVVTEAAALNDRFNSAIKCTLDSLLGRYSVYMLFARL